MPPNVSSRAGQGEGEYDPFARGAFTVGVRSIRLLDSERGRLFPCEVWYPAAERHSGQDTARETQDVFVTAPLNVERGQAALRDAASLPGTYPLVIFSHSSGAGRLSATFLCTHLSSHGYVVAAMDHSEVVAPELARQSLESEEQKAARWKALSESRVPDVEFLLNQLLGGTGPDPDVKLDPERVGIVGHSLGGWTAISAAVADARFGAVVALAPGGASRPKPGILPLELSFAGGLDAPVLYLVAENDASLPLAGMYEIFRKTPGSKRMFVLSRADHMHFMDCAEALHEAVRAMPPTGELSWLPKEMLPIAQLCSGEQAHLFVRGLTLCHLEAVLMRNRRAQEFLAGRVEAELAAHGVAALRFDEDGR